MTFTYKTRNTCATEIVFDLQDGIVTNIRFTNGCNGNLQAIASLAQGLTPEQIINKCKGIVCSRSNSTSCADQLATAVLDAYEELGGKITT